MTETKGRKKKAAAGSNGTLRLDDMTVGEYLRVTRMERKLGLEEISAAIHVRVAQLRAIEEGNIEALPGMTYAVGFVKSYAAFLKLDPAALSAKFKAEHGAMNQQMPDLQIPQPMVESRMPDPMLIGVAAFCAILLLVLWSLFSGGDEDIETQVANIPNIPSVEETMTATVEPLSSETETGAGVANSLSSAETIPPVTETRTLSPGESFDKRDDIMSFAAVAVPKPQAAAVETLSPDMPPAETITIKKAPSRVTLSAHQSSWVQIEDPKGNIILKKVLKPGEKVSVPDQPGLRLMTSNAGGFDVSVDGKGIRSFGKSGEIVRGISLDPAELKKVKVRQRLNN